MATSRPADAAKPAPPQTPVPALKDYLGRWVGQFGDLRVALTVRPGGTATVDWQDNGETPEGFVYTNPYTYDSRTGTVRLKDGQAILREDGTLRLICRDPPLKIDHTLARAQPTPPAVARKPVPAAPPPAARPDNPPAPAPAPAVVPAVAPAVALVGDNRVRVMQPDGGWPKSEWASLRISLLKSDHVGHDEHHMLVWGEKFNELSIAVGMTRAMGRKMGATRNKYGDLEVLSARTPVKKDGVIVCGFLNRKQAGDESLRVGTVLAYFSLEDWMDEQGNVVLQLPDDYWDGSGQARIFLCDEKEKVLATHLLTIPAAKAASPVTPAVTEKTPPAVAEKSPEILKLEDNLKRVPVEFLAVYREASRILQAEGKDGSYTYAPSRNRPDLEIRLPAPPPAEVLPLIESRLKEFRAGQAPDYVLAVWAGRGDKPDSTAVHAGDVWKRAVAKVYGRN